MLNVARALGRTGHRVAVWAADQGDGDAPTKVGGIAVRYLPCPMPNGTVRGALRFWRARGAARKAWRRAYLADRPEVLHVHCYGPSGFHALRLARTLLVPVVLSSHGETLMDTDGVYAHAGLLPRSLRHALRRSRTVRAVTGCSRYVLADLERRFGLLPRMGIVVADGVDPDEPSGTRPPGLPADYLLAAGTMVPAKGFDLLLIAYAQAFGATGAPPAVPATGAPPAVSHPVPDGGPTVPRLVLAGDGPQRPVLERLARLLGVADRTVFTGHLARAQLVAVMAGARALAVPSRVEASGTVILKGWRAGIPVVATDRGVPPEFVCDRETGLLVDPLDRTALANALRRTVDDPVAVAGIGAAGRVEAKRYTWDQAADAYADLYRNARRPRVTRRRAFVRPW